MQNQSKGLCNIPSVKSCGGGTDTYIVNRVVCEERSDEGLRFFKDGCCGTLRTIEGCGGKRVIEQIIIASRGRNPANPSDRTTGSPTEQRLEPNSEGICNTLTSVQKDNYVLEIRKNIGICRVERTESKHLYLQKGSENVAKAGQISNEGSQCGSVYSDDGNMATLTAGTHGDANSHICTEYRIRKLTPLECWRLMDFSDEDFHKAEEVNSNTQLYKQAGNSIVVNVLVAILGQLFAGKEEVYKDCKVKRDDTNFFEEDV